MPWVEVFAVLLVSHFVGDYLLQTDWQAQNKHRGLSTGDPVARRALLTHLATYTLSFFPALIWLGDDIGAASAVLVAVAIAVPHLIQDDGRLIAAYVLKVKGCDVVRFPMVGAAVDQTFHFVGLFVVAVLAGA